ncbi:MAG: Biofilm synthesis N-glycosyltransferase PgaC [Parcubacteria group bacterium]|nr:Biofilm synthesis N-glycosyltransferase PgaC [Parcubacteria group bacterium]
MLVEALTYPFIFLAVFFEVFLLVTFLSEPARERRSRALSTQTPKVAVVVPCWNEQNTIQGTVESLLALDYPADKLEIILVDDGSTDNTPAVMDQYAENPQVTVIHKENGGKHTAMNLGIEKAHDAVYVGCLDADSYVAPDALREIIAYFDDEKVAAVTCAMSVWDPKTLLERMQNADYIHGITLRHVISSLNGLYVTPGPFSFFRRDIVLKVGGFRNAHNTEDLEMALRLQNAGYILENAPRARVYTKTPLTVRALVKQRTRWTTGFLRNVIYDYRHMIGNKQFGTLGLFMIPIGLIANVSGIVMFGVIVVRTVQAIWNQIALVSGFPLLYTLTPHVSFSFLFFPVSFIMLLSLIMLMGAVTTMLVGKHISKTSGNLFVGIIMYMTFYGLIAPIWLIRSMYDLITGTRRGWR